MECFTADFAVFYQKRQILTLLVRQLVRVTIIQFRFPCGEEKLC